MNTYRTNEIALLTGVHPNTVRFYEEVDKNEAAPVEKILNTPSEQEDIVSVCDRLIISLENTRQDAKEMRSLLDVMNSKF